MYCAARSSMVEDLSDGELSGDTVEAKAFDPDEYEVSRVVGRDRKAPQMFYVQWANYPDDQVTLEPMTNLSGSMQVLEEFFVREYSAGGYIYHTPIKD